MSLAGCASAGRVRPPGNSKTRISVSAQYAGGRDGPLSTMKRSERKADLQEPSIRPRLSCHPPSRSDFALDCRVGGHVESDAGRGAVQIRHRVGRNVEHRIGWVDVDVLEAVVRLP